MRPVKTVWYKKLFEKFFIHSTRISTINSIGNTNQRQDILKEYNFNNTYKWVKKHTGKMNFLRKTTNTSKHKSKISNGKVIMKNSRTIEEIKMD